MKEAKLKDRLYEAMTFMGKKPVDLVNDLNIPKSAISQYLSGKSQNMDSKRLYAIANYLDVSEAWLMGYGVARDRENKKPTDNSEFSETKKELIDFANSLSEEEAGLMLRMMKTFYEEWKRSR